VRLCRALADEPVTLETNQPASLGEVLRVIARQAGTDLTAATSADGEDEVLPTLRCPGGAGDYLIIGRPPR